MEHPSDLTAELDLDLTNGRPRVDLHDPSVRAEVEQALCSIPGLLAARLVAGFDRPVDEIHVLTTLQRAPKQTVRDIQSMLMARFGVTTDHRVISVVQLEEDDAPGPASAPRLVISQVAVDQRGLTVSVRVSVTDGVESHDGEAEGPASAPGRRRATARAALDAIRPLLGAGQVVEIEGADVVEVLGHDVAICLVHFHSARGQNSVVGSALVRGDEADAVARSVLDALNRTIELAR